MSEQQTFVLELRAEPGNWRAPITKRLAIALKVLLRNFGLRAVRIEPQQTQTATNKPK